MPLAVLPTLPSDLAYPSQIYDVFFTSFLDPPSPFLQIMFPNADVISSKFRRAHDEHAKNWMMGAGAGMQYPVKCLDTDLDSGVGEAERNHTDVEKATEGLASKTGAVVGMAVFEVYWRERTEEEWKPGKVEWMEEGSAERERAEEVLGALWKKRAQIWGGRRYVYCQIVTVSPAHRRRGVASRLMQWGIDVADQLGLPMYLEATDMAVPLYEKLGFEVLENERLVHRKEVVPGAAEDVVVPLMVRMPGGGGKGGFEKWRRERDERD